MVTVVVFFFAPFVVRISNISPKESFVSNLKVPYCSFPLYFESFNLARKRYFDSITSFSFSSYAILVEEVPSGMLTVTVFGVPLTIAFTFLIFAFHILLLLL